MATRQEIFTAMDIAINTVRIGDFMWSLGNTLKDQDSKGQPLTVLIDPDNEFSSTCPTTFAELKGFAAKTKLVVKDLCRQIETILTKTDAIFLETGFGHWQTNRMDIESDVSNSGLLCDNCNIEATSEKSDLEILAVLIENYSPKIIKQINPKDLPAEINNANIVHDVIDAMSYELKGLNSYNGEGAGRKVEDVKKLIESRIKVAWVYFSYLPSNPDIDLMRSIVSYINQNLTTAKSLLDLTILGQYINSNIPKLIMVRRGWAL